MLVLSGGIRSIAKLMNEGLFVPASVSRPDNLLDLPNEFSVPKIRLRECRLFH